MRHKSRNVRRERVGFPLPSLRLLLVAALFLGGAGGEEPSNAAANLSRRRTRRRRARLREDRYAAAGSGEIGDGGIAGRRAPMRCPAEVAEGRWLIATTEPAGLCNQLTGVFAYARVAQVIGAHGVILGPMYSRRGFDQGATTFMDNENEHHRLPFGAFFDLPHYREFWAARNLSVFSLRDVAHCLPVAAASAPRPPLPPPPVASLQLPAPSPALGKAAAAAAAGGEKEEFAPASAAATAAETAAAAKMAAAEAAVAVAAAATAAACPQANEALRWPRLLAAAPPAMTRVCKPRFFSFDDEEIVAMVNDASETAAAAAAVAASEIVAVVTRSPAALAKGSNSTLAFDTSATTGAGDDALATEGAAVDGRLLTNKRYENTSRSAQRLAVPRANGLEAAGAGSSAMMAAAAAAAGTAVASASAGSSSQGSDRGEIIGSEGGGGSGICRHGGGGGARQPLDRSGDCRHRNFRRSSSSAEIVEFVPSLMATYDFHTEESRGWPRLREAFESLRPSCTVAAARDSVLARLPPTFLGVHLRLERDMILRDEDFRAELRRYVDLVQRAVELSAANSGRGGDSGSGSGDGGGADDSSLGGHGDVTADGGGTAPVVVYAASGLFQPGMDPERGEATLEAFATAGVILTHREQLLASGDAISGGGGSCFIENGAGDDDDRHSVTLRMMRRLLPEQRALVDLEVLRRSAEVIVSESIGSSFSYVLERLRSFDRGDADWDYRTLPEPHRFVYEFGWGI